METSKQGGRTLARTVAHWQSVVLIGLCVVTGLSLTAMVIGSAPTVPVQASPVETPVVEVEQISATAPEAAVETTTVLAVGVDTTEVPATDATTAVATDTVPASSSDVARLGPSTPASAVVTPTPAPSAVPSPAVPVPVPTTAAPTTAAPTTAAPTTAAPTTAVPTTAAPSVAVSYPSYVVSGIGTVGLQYDGSSIYVASVSPQTNWVFEIDRNGPSTVEVKFFNVVTENEGEFHASLDGGRIKVES